MWNTIRDRLKKNEVFFEVFHSGCISVIGLIVTGIGVYVAVAGNILFENQNKIIQRQLEIQEQGSTPMVEVGISKYHNSGDYNEVVIYNANTGAFAKFVAVDIKCYIRIFYSNEPNMALKEALLPLEGCYTATIIPENETRTLARLTHHTNANLSRWRDIERKFRQSNSGSIDLQAILKVDYIDASGKPYIKFFQLYISSSTPDPLNSPRTQALWEHLAHLSKDPDNVINFNDSQLSPDVILQQWRLLKDQPLP